MIELVGRRVLAIAAGAVAQGIVVPSRLRTLECTLKDQMVFSGRTMSYYNATAWNEGADLKLRIELTTRVAIERPNNPSRTIGGDDHRVVMVMRFELTSDSTELVPEVIYLDFNPSLLKIPYWGLARITAVVN